MPQMVGFPCSREWPTPMYIWKPIIGYKKGKEEEEEKKKKAHRGSGHTEAQDT